VKSDRRSDSSSQQLFSQLVVGRDKMCVFCQSKLNLEAAHIFDVKLAKAENSMTMMESLKLSSLYETWNGLTLCHDCHKYFDWHLCSVHMSVENEPTSVEIVITDALKLCSDDEICRKWVKLDKMPVVVPTDADVIMRKWPTAQLFQFRYDNYEEANAKRRADNFGKVICDICHQAINPNQLARHLVSKACAETHRTME
jgi:hypothetical protein